MSGYASNYYEQQAQGAPMNGQPPAQPRGDGFYDQNAMTNGMNQMSLNGNGAAVDPAQAQYAAEAAAAGYMWDEQSQQWVVNPAFNGQDPQQQQQQYYPDMSGYTGYDANGQPITAEDYAAQQYYYQQQQQQQQQQQAPQPQQGSDQSSFQQTQAMRQGQHYLPPADASLSKRPSQSQPSPPPSAKPASRIDPKQIPRAETERPGNKTPEYHTMSGTVPPPSTSSFVVVDEGNCSPRFMRMTTYQVAADEELIENTKLVVGAVIQPLADLGNDEEPIHVVDPGPSGPIRCSRCRGYINPFFKFIAGGAKFICSLCNHENPVPEEYKCNLDPNGFRRDRFQRPELCRGTVEFVAPPEFILRPIQDPCYLFVVDVSYTSIATGLLRVVVDGIRMTLDALAQNPRARVGFITYHSAVQFYAIRPPRKEPQMFVVADVEDMFVPVPSHDMLVRISDPASRALVDALLNMLPVIYEKTKSQGCALGAAVQGAMQALTGLGGKILLTQSNLPQVGAGSLENRDDVKLYYTDNEKTLFVPQTSFYDRIGTECAENAITVDVYAAANSYVDLATVGTLATFTGGQIYLYEGFTARKDGEALQADLWHNLTRRTGFDGVMVVRTSDGLKVADTFGNFFRRRAHEMELPSIDCDKTFGVTLKHDGKLQDKSSVCIQTALLYTTEMGERRIRVHTISLPVTSVMGNIFRFADLDSVVALSLKQACKQILHTTTPPKVRQALVNACIDSLFVYRKFCATSTSPGQLILPESLKLLPLSTLGMVKHPLFHNGQRADERAFLFAFVASMPTYVSIPFICPRLFSLTDIPVDSCVPDSEGRVFLPPCASLSSESINPQGLYLLDDGRALYIWIGDNLYPDVTHDVFDVDPNDPSIHPSQYRISQSHLDDPNHISTKILQLLYQLRKRKPNYPNLSIIARKKAHFNDQDPALAKALLGETLDESQFFKHLLEDAGGLQSYNIMSDGEDKKAKDAKDPSLMSYIDFLCYIHKRIQDKFY